MNSNWYSHKDIEQLCGLSTSSAYRMIKQLNTELKEQGYIVPKAGYVLKKYADERLGMNM